jgi:hypothetical protein
MSTYHYLVCAYTVAALSSIRELYNDREASSTLVVLMIILWPVTLWLEEVHNITHIVKKLEVLADGEVLFQISLPGLSVCAAIPIFIWRGLRVCLVG